MENRKKDHINLAFDSKTAANLADSRFWYEPMLSGHKGSIPLDFSLAGKKLKVPLWISSMTGGTEKAARINRNLARLAGEFGMGMGLGSCRILLYDNRHFSDFNVRDDIGSEYPLFANLGIAQLEELTARKELSRIEDLTGRLRTDGLIIHVNPLQEWFQPEGDRLKRPPAETIAEYLETAHLPVIVKEVGQGMGRESLKTLLQMPLEAIEFAAFGGTNFSKAELLRSGPGAVHSLEALAHVGHTAADMLESVNEIVSENEAKCRKLIISGGIESFLDGYWHIKRSSLPAIYGQASAFLKYAADDYSQLRDFAAAQIRGLELAYSFLRIRD